MDNNEANLRKEKNNKSFPRKIDTIFHFLLCFLKVQRVRGKFEKPLLRCKRAHQKTTQQNTQSSTIQQDRNMRRVRLREAKQS